MEEITEDLKADLKKGPQVEVILGHTFRVWHEGHKARDYWVRLTPDKLILSPSRDHEATLPGLCCICPLGCCVASGQDLEVKRQDIVVCKPSMHNEDNYMKKSLRNKVRPEVVGHPVFMIVAYPIVNAKSGFRARKVMYFNHMASVEEQEARKRGHVFLSEAVRIRDTWVHAILTSFFPISHDDPTTVQPADVWPNQFKKLLVVINPASGTGAATKVMSSILGPGLQEANIEYEVLLTERQGHAHEVIQAEYQLTKRWKGIVVIGGDGTFYEVLNGIFARPDWQDVFKKVVLGVVPGGSGNGLTRSIIHALNEPYDGKGCTSSMLNIVRGNRRKMDLYLAETKAEDGHQQNVGFLHISYGIIADVDIESEAIRSWGSIRFTIYALLRIAKLRSYKAKLWYRPVVQKDEPNKEIPDKEEELVVDEPESISYCSSEKETEVQEITMDMNDEQKSSTEADQSSSGTSSSGAEEDDEHEVVPNFDGGQRATYGTMLIQGHLYFRSWNELQAQILPQPAQKNHHYFPSAPPPLPPLPSATPTMRPSRQKFQSKIPDLNQELKPESLDGWIYEESDFIMITYLNCPYIDGSSLTSPQSQIDDGIQYLMIIRGGATKSTLLKFMQEMEKGNHTKIPEVDMIPVTAMRLIPCDDKLGYLTMDGESIPVGPIQAQTLPSMIDIFTK